MNNSTDEIPPQISSPSNSVAVVSPERMVARDEGETILYQQSTKHECYNHSSEDMHELKDNSIHLVITSPPYNENKPYDEKNQNADSLDWIDYIEFILKVFSECKRVLVPGGRICVNIANLGRHSNEGQRYKDMSELYKYILRDELSMIIEGIIIWDKGASANVNTAWGSYCNVSRPVLRDVHEFILVFSKPDEHGNSISIDTTGYRAGISKKDFHRLTKSIWTIPAVKNLNHPAVFPDLLVENLMKLYSAPRMVVLDPFGGSGTTARVAKRMGRNSVLYEVVPKFFKYIEDIKLQSSIKDWFVKLPNPKVFAKEGLK